VALIRRWLGMTNQWERATQAPNYLRKQRSVAQSIPIDQYRPCWLQYDQYHLKPHEVVTLNIADGTNRATIPVGGRPSLKPTLWREGSEWNEVGGGKAQWREEVGLGIPLAPIHFWCFVAACSCSELLSAGPTTKTAGAYQAFVPFSSSFLLSFRHARTQHNKGGRRAYKSHRRAERWRPFPLSISLVCWLPSSGKRWDESGAAICMFLCSRAQAEWGWLKLLVRAQQRLPSSS
jgi:hypothetical protein